jgi:integrase
LKYKTIEDGEQSYLDNLYLISHSENSHKTYKTTIKLFRSFLIEKFSCNEIELVEKIHNDHVDVYDILQSFVVHMDKQGIKGNTIRIRFSSIKGYLSHLGVKISTDEVKHIIKIPRVTRLREIPITKEMIVRLLRNSKPKLQVAILVAISTGLRLGELVNLRIMDVDFTTTPTTVYVRGNTTKTRQSRVTFLSAETTNALKDYLVRYHKWSEDVKDPMLSEKHIFQAKIKPKKPEQFSVLGTQNTLGSELLVLVKSIPELAIKNENGRQAIHFHAFRKYFRTIVGNSSGRDFAENLIGHSFYMDTYYQLSDEKKREMYLEVEPLLTISDFEAVEKNIQKLSQKNTQLEEKFNDLLLYLKTNSIKIPEFAN